MTYSEKKVSEFESKSGITVKDKSLLIMALTHPSYANAKTHNDTNYERLEFLGDAVLKMIVSEYLYKLYPDYPEGKLTKIRARVISDRSLADIGKQIGLGQYLLLSNSEKKMGGANRPSSLANAFEAVLGCLFLDNNGCLDAARNFCLPLIEEHLEDLLAHDTITDYKSALQEKLQQQGLALPGYEIINQEGPDHNREFFVKVTFEWAGRQQIFEGKGTTKKSAQQVAAKAAYTALT